MLCCGLISVLSVCLFAFDSVRNAVECCADWLTGPPPLPLPDCSTGPFDGGVKCKVFEGTFVAQKARVQRTVEACLRPCAREMIGGTSM
jgi:hypothetical protein